MPPSDTRTATVTIQASSAAMGSVPTQILGKAAPCPISDTHLIFAGCSGVFKCRLSPPVQRCTSYRCLRVRDEPIHPTNVHVFHELKKIGPSSLGAGFIPQVRPSCVAEVHTVVDPICFNRATHNPHHHPHGLRALQATSSSTREASDPDISPTCMEGFSDPRAFQRAVGKTIPPVPSSGITMSMDTSKVFKGDGTSPISHQSQPSFTGPSFRHPAEVLR